MCVLIEAVNVVTRNKSVESRFKGGVKRFERNCPNATFCTDGVLCRVGFMTQADAEAYIESLAHQGLRLPTPEGTTDLALVVQGVGSLFPCDWLSLGRATLDDDRSADVAWTSDAAPGELAVPPGWTPSAVRLMPSPLPAGVEFQGTEGNVDAYRDRATGERHLVGRTGAGEPPAGLSGDALEEQLNSLAEELERAGAFEGSQGRGGRGKLEAIHERAKRLVERTGGREPRSLHLLGIAARMRSEWQAAASAFRRLAELRPDFVEAWLELTWALAALKRFAEAERAARKAVELAPKRGDALGNLAAVLLESGKLEEALPVAEQAVRAAPNDQKNRAVLRMIKERRPKKPPWWKR